MLYFWGFLGFLAVMSLIAYILYAADKNKAQKKRWRTKESVLLGFGFCGGALGALLAMQLCRHKTKHWYFWAVNILGLIWQTALLLWLFTRLPS